MKPRAHRKRKPGEVTVYPRPQWTALKTDNHRLVFGFLVYKTMTKLQHNNFKKQRQETLTERDLFWNGVHVSNADLAEFLQARTGIHPESARKTIKRTLQFLERVNYIVMHGDTKLVNQRHLDRAIEVLWDDKKYVFITPYKKDKSISAGTLIDPKINSAGTLIELSRDRAGTKTASAGTLIDASVPAQNQEYGSTKPQNDDSGGAPFNTILLITCDSADSPHGEGSSLVFNSSKDEVEQGNTHATMSSMIPGSNYIDQSDLLPAFRVREDRLRTPVDKPADLFSFAETKGIAGTGHDWALNRLIKHIKQKYNYDCSHIFTAENYRRLICPDLRADIPLEFGELPNDLIEQNFFILPHIFDQHMQSKLYQDCPDMFHRVVTLFRSAPRGISYHYDTGGYWYPPVMPMALDYSSYVKSPKTTESKFHRDATTTQLREIVYASRLPEVEVNGKAFTALYFNVVLKRQIFWLAGTTAMSREALEGMMPRFEKELLQNSQSPDYKRYQKKIQSGNFGEVNLINWFKDLCFRYHYHGWYIDRLKNDDGGLFLSGLGASCDTSGASPGTIAYLPMPWGQTREMFFTRAQWKMYEKFKNTVYLNNIGQDSL